MAKKLGIGIIHGMGTHKPDFAQDMIDELSKRLNKMPGKKASDVAFQAIHWSDVLSASQDKYLLEIKTHADVDFVKLREFMIKAMGDAAGYQKSTGPNSTYVEIHEKIRDDMATLQTTVGDPDAPLIIMAHSLGGHIISNYIYDIQQYSGVNPAVVQPGNTPFEKFETLSGMVTFGCNIPLFTFAQDPVVSIDFPAPGLDATLAGKARWYNYYDPDDILGYPLKLIGRCDPNRPHYKDVVDEDRAINVGGIFANWNPMSHSKYWTDNDFTKPVAKQIAKFI